MAQDNASLSFYRATTVAEVIRAQRALGELPELCAHELWARTFGVPRAGGLRDPAIFVDPFRSAAAISLPFPVVHPVVLREVAKVLGTTADVLRGIGTGNRPDDGDGALDWLCGQDEACLPGSKELARLIASRAEVLVGDAGIDGSSVKPEDLLVTRLPVIPIALRPLSDALAPHRFDQQAAHLLSLARYLLRMKQLDAPSMILDDWWDLLQGSIENLVEWASDRPPVSPRWIPSDAVHVSSFLRSDKGVGLSADQAWTWATAPVCATGYDHNHLRSFDENPFAPRSRFVLAVVLLDDRLVLVLRHGLALVRIDGALVAWRPHAPVRPFANDGARVAVLGPHPRGGYFPELSVFDARDATWSEEWPASFPTSVLSGHWAAKSMVIFDLAGRRERLLRQDKRDDYQHHTSSPDGRYAWLHEAPQEGIVDVIDGTCAFDLAAIDCGKRRGNFTRAFVQHADSAFRIYTRGAFYRGRERVWSDHAAHARHAAAFDRAGARLVTVDSANVRIRALDALGHVTSEVISKLPLTRRDFSLPPELAEPLLGDLLFGEVGPLTMIAERAEEEVCARVVEAVRALPSWDRPKRNDDEIEQWTRRAHAYARAHDAGPRGHGGM